jgi:hypothetical protein
MQWTATPINTFGPLILALFMVATTRWGSYLIPGPPYIADLVVIALFADRIVALAGRASLLAPMEPLTRLAVTFLLIVAGVNFLFGAHTVDALRDFAPFAYALLVYLAPPIHGRNLEASTRSLLMVCLYFHLAWTTATLVVPGVATALITPGNDSLYIFSVRPDIDGVVNGIAASIGLYRLLGGRRGALLLAWGATLVLIQRSRIPLLALPLELLCVVAYAAAQRRRGWVGRTSGVFVLDSTWRRIRSAPRTITAAIICVFVIVFGIGVLQPTALNRLGWPGGGSADSQTTGTTQAREESWSTLGNWILSSPERALVGTGFGTNIMAESGADTDLLGAAADPDVRAPHNYLMTTWARLGVLGLGAVLLMLVAGGRLMVRARCRPMNDLDIFASLLLLGIPAAAVVGVVMESPFGAIPYFWALGYMASMDNSVRNYSKAGGMTP